MKIIKIREVEMQNFKGIKDLKIEFDDRATNIKGDNAVGKTSIFDAFTWLMFDKDSKNRTTFDIKPLNSNNEHIREANPTVKATLVINGTETTLSKTLKEKWVTKRGESEKTFTGNETIYEIDNVPVKKSEYQAKVNEIAGEEQFKLLSNPLFFSEVLNWKDARKILLDITGDVEAEHVIESNQDLKQIEELLQKTDIETLMKQKKATIKKLADEKKSIPARIEEINLMFQEVDIEEIQKAIDEKQNILSEIDEHLTNANNSDKEKLDLTKAMYELEAKKEHINNKAISQGSKAKFEKTKALNDEELKLEEYKNTLKRLQQQRNFEEKEIKDTKDIMETIRKDWFKIKKKEIDLGGIQTACPTCKREFESEDIEETRTKMLNNFNSNKAKELETTQQLGMMHKKKLEEREASLKGIDIAIADINKAIESQILNIMGLKKEVEETESKPVFTYTDRENIDNIEINIAKLKEKIESTENIVDTTAFKQQKAEITKELNLLNKELGKEDYNKDLTKRQNDLIAKESTIGTQIATEEKILILCETYIKSRINLLEKRINEKFKNVSFKMFKQQINGGIDETCEALIGGVPFTSANTASQINAGMDIINTMSEHYKIQLPVFIDNREAINELIETSNQLINLIVSKDKTLQVEKGDE